jgi:hypothetical protein
MAVDGVQSEPLSGEFPLTGNKTEKIRPSRPSRRREILYPTGYTRLMAVWSDPGPFGTGNID